MSKIIVVFGATGAQGGGVVKAILADQKLSKEFKIRAITRDSSKPSAKKLAEQGAELATADLNSKDSVLKALKDAHTVFLVTNFWEHGDRSIEVSQGKLVTDAAKAAGVQHMIFSSLDNVTKISGGKLPNVSHFDGKNDIEQYIRNSGIPTSSFVLPGFYMTNIVEYTKKGDDGVYTLALPVSENAQFPLLDTVNDLGKFAVPALKLPASKANGIRLLAATDYYKPGQMMSQLERVSGKKTRFVSISEDTYKSFLPPQHAQEIYENMKLLDGPGYYGGEGLEETRKLLDQELTSWETFVKHQKVWME